ncbi:MAG TPA: hypothetical protein VF026_01910 [Ktedonobacteraceae bacterium]
MGEPEKLSARLDQEREALWYLGGLRIIKALGEHSPGGWNIIEEAPPAGTLISSFSPSPEDSAFFLLEGDAIFVSGSMTVHATAGTFLFLPRNLSYRYEVGRPHSARILVWTTPLGLAHQVMRMGIPGQALVLLPPRLLDQEKMQQLATLLRNATGTFE